MPFQWIVYALVALAPLASYGWAAVKFKIEAEKAVSLARIDEQTKCNKRVESIELQINQAIDEGIKDARAAAEEIEDTPTADEDLKALCKRSASCRNRSEL